MIVSFFTDNLFIQTAVFVVSSCVLILSTKPLVNRYVHNKPTKPTNVSSLIGTRGVVTAEINPMKALGQVKVNGQIWSAKCDEDIVIAKDTEIEVTKVEGVKLIVAPVKAN